MDQAGRRFHQVAVLMGGPSEEREVSLCSGKAVASALGEVGYEVVPIDIVGHDLEVPRGVEAVFVALHGEFGEDGELQRRLERLDLPYTGSGPEASRRAFDKELSKKALSDAGIPTPAYELVRNGQTPSLPLPAVVKPTCQGSSIGAHRIREPGDWGPALADAFLHGDTALVEAYIPGRELTVSIVQGEALPLVEIFAPEGWYDYKAKYTEGMCRYVVPAEVDAGVTASCQELARRTFDTLGCRGFGRVDFRITESGEPLVLELNSIPGFTETSLLPKAARCHGMSFADLCDRIMNAACLTREVARP